MGICLNKQQQPQSREIPKNKTIQSQIENVDVVKMKLKQARDRIKTFITKKNVDVVKIDEQIATKLPKFKETGDKRELIPLLRAKKELLSMVEKGDVRLELVNQKLAQVQLQQVNKETIDVLDQSNKYIQTIQEELQNKDWRNVLAEAQNKCEIEWPNDQEEIQEDPAFQKMWDELGGNKLAKPVEKKRVEVQVGMEVGKEKMVVA